MPVYYQKQDASVIDYQSWLLINEAKFFARGPELNPGDLANGNYFSVMGAAETLGRLVKKPYGALLSQQLELPCLNLGRGGAGPAFFNHHQHQKLFDYINKGKFLILSFMSARQTGNSCFTNTEGDTQCLYKGERTKVDDAWKHILEEFWKNKKFLKDLIMETRQSYSEEYLNLINQVKVPVILFYFSQRKPRYSYNWSVMEIRSLWSLFPHFVDHRTVKKILKKSAVQYAECITKRGIPYTVKDKNGIVVPIKYSGVNKEITYHSYYPSPEMHEDAAKVLEPLCEKILKNNTGP